MDEDDYWVRLEHRVCREFEGFADPELRRNGCLGFRPEEFALSPQPCVRGMAWCGPNGQDRWRFTLLVDPECRSREEIDWPRLLPDDGLTGWLSPHPRQQSMVIDPLSGYPDE